MKTAEIGNSKTSQQQFRREAIQLMEGERVARGEISSLWPAPYDNDSLDSRTRFILECCQTLEETSGVAMAIPDLPHIRWYIKVWHEARLQGKKLVCLKSRRMLVSWVDRCLELHQLGLNRGTHLVSDRIYASAAQHCWRFHFVYENLRLRFPKWNLSEDVAAGSVLKQECESVSFPNGSLVKMMNSQANRLQGAGIQSICFEELSQYDNVNSNWAQGLTVTQGVQEGFVRAITNASDNPEFLEMKEEDTLIPPPLDAPNGCRIYQARSGTWIITIHYTADPAKADPMWKVKTSAGYSAPEWEREFEMAENAYAGRPVMSNFRKDLHVSDSMGWLWPNDWSYVVGIDCGSTLNQAAVIFAIEPEEKGNQSIVAVKEFQGLETNFISFMQKIQNFIQQKLPDHFEDVRYVGDRTVETRAGISGQSSRKVINREFGITIHAQTNTINARLFAVEWLLNLTKRNGEFSFKVLIRDCPLLYRAMAGGYRFNAEGKPEKNEHSHLADALQYGALETKKKIYDPPLKIYSKARHRRNVQTPKIEVYC